MALSLGRYMLSRWGESLRKGGKGSTFQAEKKSRVKLYKLEKGMINSRNFKKFIMEASLNMKKKMT